MTYLNDDQIRAAMRASMRRHPSGKQRLRLTERGQGVIGLAILALVLLAWAWLEGHPV